MKKWGLLLLATLLIIVISACGKKEDSASVSGNEPTGGAAQEKVYKFATDAAYAPMELMDKDQIVGFSPDFLALVMQEAGLKYELVNTGWDPMLEFVKQGTEYDAGISSISITDDRKETYDFTVPYFESVNMIMSKKDSGLTTGESLKDKKVAVQNATTADLIMSEIMGKDNPNLRRFETNTLAFIEMQNGGVDAVVADNTIIGEYLKNNPDKDYEGHIDPSFPSEFYGILLPKNSELKAKLDPAIKKVVASEAYKDIYRKWIGGEPDVERILKAQEEG
jgi:polar amino acid transport system substrate-binding protein